VGVVDHHDGAVFFTKHREFIDGADVAIHGENAVGDDEFAAWLMLDFLQQLFAVRDIFVAEDFDLGARKAGAVDDAGVVQFVGEDEVFFAEDARDGTCIGREAGMENDTGFYTFEGGDFFFKLHVDAHRAGDGADGTRANAEFLRRGDGCLAKLGVVAEAEVVVRGEVDDLLAVVVADRGLLVVEHPEAEEGAALAEFVELGCEMRELPAGGSFESTHTTQMLNLFVASGSERRSQGHHTLHCYKLQSGSVQVSGSTMQGENDDR
jgi:hypothetical protein